MKFDPQEGSTPVQAMQAMQHPFSKEVDDEYSLPFQWHLWPGRWFDEVLSEEQEVFFNVLEGRYSEEAEVNEVNEIASDAKEQDTNATRSSSSDISQGFRDENFSNDYIASICQLETKKCSSRLRENSKS